MVARGRDTKNRGNNSRRRRREHAPIGLTSGVWERCGLSVSKDKSSFLWFSCLGHGTEKGMKSCARLSDMLWIFFSSCRVVIAVSSFLYPKNFDVVYNPSGFCFCLPSFECQAGGSGYYCTFLCSLWCTVLLGDLIFLSFVEICLLFFKVVGVCMVCVRRVEGICRLC